MLLIYMSNYIRFSILLIFLNICNVLSLQISYIYRYKSQERKQYKKYMGYNKYVQDHHCIPRQFRHHPLLRILSYDVDCSTNLRIMPTRNGIYILNLDPKTMSHCRGHPLYNKYVGKQLNYINKLETIDMKRYQFWLFLSFLKKNLQFNEDNIPW